MSATAIPPGWTLQTLTDPFEALAGPLYERPHQRPPQRPPQRNGEPEPARDLAFRVAQQHTNARGVAHGGMVMTFLDAALGCAAADACGRQPIATVTLNVDFVGPGHLGDWVVARTNITRRTRSLIFVTGDLVAEGGDGAAATKVATASAIFKVLGV